MATQKLCRQPVQTISRGQRSASGRVETLTVFLLGSAVGAAGADEAGGVQSGGFFAPKLHSAQLCGHTGEGGRRWSVG